MRPLLAAALLVLAGCPDRGQPAPAAPAAPGRALTSADAHHLLLTLQADPSGVRVLDARVAPGPAPELRAAEHQPWRVELLDAQGQVVAATELAAPNVVRAPPAPSGPPAQVVTDSASFAARLPQAPGAVRVRVLADPKTLTPTEAARIRAVREGRTELGDAELPATK